MLLEEDDADEDMISEQDVSNSDEDMVCDDVVSFKTSEEDEDMVSEYVHNSDEDMISDEEYIDTSKKDDKKKVDKKPLRMPQIALITARNRHKPSLTTKPPTTSTPPFAPQQEGKQMMHTTVQMASSDSLTLIGILKNKESVHRSCFLGFFCGGGYNYKEKQAIVQRSTEFHWLSRFIKAFKCTSVDLKYVYFY